MVLRKGVKVASVESLNTVAFVMSYKTQKKADKENQNVLQFSKQICNMNAEELEAFAFSYKFKINPEITSKQRLNLLRLLFDYKHVFARSLKKIRQYPNYKLELNLLTDKKVFRRKFLLNKKNSKLAQQQIDEMHSANTIEPALDANFNFFIFLVAKKTGEKRLVIDLRHINEIILPKPV